MDPVKKTELRRVTYWTCNVPNHRHQSHNSALSCMLRRKGVKGEIHKIKRNLIIIERLKHRHKPAEIAAHVNCSESNLVKAANSSLIKAYDRASKNGGCPYKRKAWTAGDFSCPARVTELQFLTKILEEYLLTLSPNS